MKEIFALIFLIQQMLDGYTTYMVLKRGGREVNPFMQIAMNFLGVLPALIVTKFIVIAAFIVYAEIIPIWTWILAIGFYVFVLVNNFRVLEDMDKLK